MTAFGPYTAVAGQLQTCQLGPLDSRSILIQNRSRFDLGISLANHVPPVVSQFGGGEWDSVVPAGDRAAIDIDELNYVRGAWMGQMYVLPIDTATNQALSGVFSQNPVFYARTSPLPAPGGGYSASLGTDVTNQPRIIALPMGVLRYFTNRVSFSGTVSIGAFNLTATQIAAKTAIFYLYQFLLSLDNVTTGSVNFTLGIQFFTGLGGTGSTVGSFIPLLKGNIAANTTPPALYPYSYLPPNPLVLGDIGTVPPTAQSAMVQLLHDSGATVTISYFCAINLDPTNLVPVTDIGTTGFFNSSQASF